MSKENITLRYDGPALADHQMDVAYLAPALYALGDLCKVANRTFNEDRAAVHVLVNVNREQNCFEFGIELAMSFVEQTRAFLNDERIQDAKELAEWLGLAGVPAAGYGLFRLIKWLSGRQPEFTNVRDEDGRDMVQVTVQGDNNSVTVTPQVKEMYENRIARVAAKRVVEPLEGEGYDSLEFLENGQVTESFNKDEASGVLRMPDNPPDSETEYEPQEIKAWIKVYAPVFDENAPNWRFEYGEGHTHMDISETNIASEAVRRGSVSPGDYYYVRLEITQVETDSGKVTNRYKVKEVLDFQRRDTRIQETMRLDDPEA